MLKNFQQRIDHGVLRLEQWATSAWRARLTTSWTLGLILAVLCVAQLHELQRGDIKDWDEGLYAWRAKIAHYLGGEYWLDQTDYSYPGGNNWTYGDGRPFVGKPSFYSGCFPPLFVWMMGGSYRLFGVSSWAARLPATLLGFAAILSIFVAGCRMGHSRWAGFWSAFFLGSLMFFLEYTRKAQFDGPLVCWMTITAAAYAIWQEDRRWRWLAATGIALGLGLMTKIILVFFVAIFIGITGLFHIYAQRSLGWRRCFAGGLFAGIFSLFWGAKFIALFLLLALAIAFIIERKITLAYMIEQAAINILALLVALPWHLYMTLKHGRLFWDWYIGYHLIVRSRETLDGHVGEWYYYINAMWGHLPSPTLALALVAIAFGCWRLFSRHTSHAAENNAELSVRKILQTPIRWDHFAGNYLFLISWILIPLIIISASDTRRQVYLLLIVPAYALLAGIFLVDAKRRINNRWAWLAGLFLIALLTILSRSRSMIREFYLNVFLKITGLTIFDRVVIALQTLAPAIIGALCLCLIIFLLAGKTPALKKICLFMITVVVIIFCLRNWKGLFKGDGKHNFGWSQIESYVADRDNYDILIYWGDYWNPSITYYFDGLQGLEPPVNLFNTEFYMLNAKTTDDVLREINALPNDKRILLICDVGNLFLRQYSKETIEEIRDQFTLYPDSKSLMVNGLVPFLEARHRESAEN